MIGREAYHRPAFINELAMTLHNQPAVDQLAVMRRYQEYIAAEVAAGTRLHDMTRHALGMFSGVRGARRYRQLLSDTRRLRDNDPALVSEAVDYIESQAA